VTHDHHIGGLVVIDDDQAYGLILDIDSFPTPRGVIGIVVDKVPGYGPEFNVNVLHVLWSDGITRTCWDYQALPLKE
jgi:hypothetical protein